MPIVCESFPNFKFNLLTVSNYNDTKCVNKLSVTLFVHDKFWIHKILMRFCIIFVLQSF